jgi:hypothetical protein
MFCEARAPDWNQHRTLQTPEQDLHIHIDSPGWPEIQRT